MLYFTTARTTTRTSAWRRRDSPNRLCVVPGRVQVKIKFVLVLTFSFQMDHKPFFIVSVIFIVAASCYEPFKIPKLTIEAFEPQGLRISLPAKEGIEVFAFHGKINKEIAQIDQGDLEQHVTNPTNGKFVYIDKYTQLKTGDEIYYWIFIQHNNLGFRKDNQRYTIKGLLPIAELETPNSGPKCSRISITKSDYVGEKFCSGATIIDYKFSQKPIDNNIWSIEEYISLQPDWGFHVYRTSMVDITNSCLSIKPKIVIENAQETIDIRQECTQKGFCMKDTIATWNPPAISGRVHSLRKFAFINVTVKAKLPIGDYIYPEIYLEDPGETSRRILIAYARGNEEYIEGKTNKNEGGSVLYGGPYNNVKEPDRSKHLASYLYNEHIGNQWHTFNMIWMPNGIYSFIDGKQFGKINEDALKETGFNRGRLARIVFGVGVGGPFEFPDGYTSGNKRKPFGSSERDAIRSFVNNSKEVLKTWSDDKSKLEVEYVTVTAI